MIPTVTKTRDVRKQLRYFRYRDLFIHIVLLNGQEGDNITALFGHPWMQLQIADTLHRNIGGGEEGWASRMLIGR
jgi:hypothetical protein